MNVRATSGQIGEVAMHQVCMCVCAYVCVVCVSVCACVCMSVLTIYSITHIITVSDVLYL